jgi:hypothetical protein
MTTLKSNEIIFSITIKDLQIEANEKIGRELTDEEIEVAKKGFESGLLFDIDTVFETILFELIEK